MEHVLVTGGAGFIGSHLVDGLISNYKVTVLDDLSGGDINNLKDHQGKENFRFLKGSITSKSDVLNALEGVTTVYHFAAQPDVRLSNQDPIFDFEINVVGSVNLLEMMRKNDIRRIIFASSGGTVYGKTEIFPTPEFTPLVPISNYGAAKCAFEMYLSSYAELYNFQAASIRFANIIGPRLDHGVIFDFYNKLKTNPTRLEVLGDGRQEKAYMYVTDTVDAIMMVASKMKTGHNPVNVSSGERLTVEIIAELVCEGLGCYDARIEYTGGKQGWIGDVIITDLDISLLQSYGWEKKIDLETGVDLYLKWLVDKYGPTK